MKLKIFWIIILCLSLLSSATQAVTVFVAGGFVNANEINPALLTAAKITAGATIKESTQTVFEWAQTFVLAELRKRILDMIVDQIIQWVQGGGEPKFVTDWRGFLEDVGQAAVGDLTQFLGLGFLCQPFNTQVQLALRQPPRFAEQVSCTLDQIVGNIENFFSDFRNGGFIAYQTLWQPQNNFYGLTLLAWDAKEKEIAARTEAARNEALAGGGFLSTKNTAGQITTPGSIIGATVAKAVGSDIDYIVNAEQLGAYVSAIADALVNRLIRGGVDGLRGLNTPGAPGAGSVSSTQRGPCTGLSGTALQSCLNYNRATDNSFTTARTTMISDIDQTLSPRLEAKNIVNSSISTLQDYIGTLNNLYTNLFTRQKKIGFETICQKTTGELQQEILNEIEREETAISRLRQDLNDNQAVIDSLEIAKRQMQNVPQGDWASLTVTIDNVRDELDPLAAESFKSAAQSENDNIKSRTAEKLNSFREQISQCYQ